MTEIGEKSKYLIKIDKFALKFLDNLDEDKYLHLIKEIFKLEKEPRPVGCVKLNVNKGYRINGVNIEFYTLLMTLESKYQFIKSDIEKKFIKKDK